MYFTDKQLLVSEWWKKNAAVVRANSISYIACWQFMIVKYVDFSFPYFNIPPSYMASIYSHSFQMISALDVEFLVWVFFCSSVVVIFVHSFFSVQILQWCFISFIFPPKWRYSIRSGKRFTVYFIWNSALYFVSIVLKLFYREREKKYASRTGIVKSLYFNVRYALQNAAPPTAIDRDGISPKKVPFHLKLLKIDTLTHTRTHTVICNIDCTWKE